MRHRLLVAVVVLAAASSSAFAGVVITSTHVDLASKEESPIGAFIEADRLKIVTPRQHRDLSRRPEENVGDRNRRRQLCGDHA